MTQNTAAYARHLPREHEDATAYPDPLQAADAYDGSGKYDTDRDAWAQDQIALRGAAWFVAYVNKAGGIDDAYSESDDYRTAVDDVYVEGLAS